MGFLRDAKHRGKPKKKLSGKALDFSIESLLTKPTPNDYCWIDLKDGRYHHNGNFAAVSKYKQYWKFEYRLSLLPADHWRTKLDMTDETLHETDHYELIYIHPCKVMAPDIMSMVRRIYVTFVDPKTLVYLAEVKVTALTEIEAKAALKRVPDLSAKGYFDKIDVTEEFDIDYWYDGSGSEQVELFTKQPLTNVIVEE